MIVRRNWGSCGNCNCKDDNEKKFRLFEKHQGGKYYDCNDNGRARAAGNSQECIDKVLSKPNPFGNEESDCPSQLGSVW